MITKRIIPCLDVRNGRVVKGKNFEGIQDVSDPVEMAKFYNREGADKLVFYDITARALYRYTHESGVRDIHTADSGRRHKYSGRF